MGQAALHERADRRHHCLAQLFVVIAPPGSIILVLIDQDTGFASRCGSRQMPHSVIKCGHQPGGRHVEGQVEGGAPLGTTLTVSMAPEEVRPVICVIPSPIAPHWDIAALIQRPVDGADRQRA